MTAIVMELVAGMQSVEGEDFGRGCVRECLNSCVSL